MAVSLLEQRHSPLRSPAQIFGLHCTPPWVELLRSEDLTLAAPLLRRSKSWGGFAAWWQHPKGQLGASKAGDSTKSRTSEDKTKTSGPEEKALAGSTRAGSRAGSSTDGPEPSDSPDSMDADTTRYDYLSDGDADSDDYEPHEDVLQADVEQTGQHSVHIPKATEGDANQKHNTDRVDMDALRAWWNSHRVVTTVMIRNLNQSVSRSSLINTLNSMGFEGSFNYVHLPRIFGTGRNKGFAFVNFAETTEATRFMSNFQPSYPAQTKFDDDSWYVAPAVVQGYQANAVAARSQKMRRIRKSCYRPLFVSTTEPNGREHGPRQAGRVVR